MGGREFDSGSQGQGLKITYSKRKCFLCNYICKLLDFQVFLDKDCKPEVPSHSPCWKFNSMGR